MLIGFKYYGIKVLCSLQNGKWAVIFPTYNIVWWWTSKIRKKLGQHLLQPWQGQSSSTLVDHAKAPPDCRYPSLEYAAACLMGHETGFSPEGSQNKKCLTLRSFILPICHEIVEISLGSPLVMLGPAIDLVDSQSSISSLSTFSPSGKFKVLCMQAFPPSLPLKRNGQESCLLY